MSLEISPVSGVLPFGLALAAMVRDLAAPGAPAVRCWPSGLERDFGSDQFGVEVVLPLVDVAGDGSEWLRPRLGQLRRNGRPLPEAAVDLLAGHLAPGGACRADGLPVYSPAGPGAEVQARTRLGTLPAGVEVRVVDEFDRRAILQPLAGPGRSATFTAASVARRANRRGGGRAGQRDTAPIRAVFAAVAHDVLGLTAAEVGIRILGQQPAKREHDPASSHAWRQGGGPYAVWGQGRAWLAHLGCWPWALAPAGRLPRRWHAEAEYRSALHRWHLAED